jgi:hypothetical protein
MIFSIKFRRLLRMLRGKNLNLNLKKLACELVVKRCIVYLSRIAKSGICVMLNAAGDWINKYCTLEYIRRLEIHTF